MLQQAIIHNTHNVGAGSFSSQLSAHEQQILWSENGKNLTAGKEKLWIVMLELEQITKNQTPVLPSSSFQLVMQMD